MDSRTVGILGGGQLGRMLVEAANRLNVKTIILDAPNSPAKQISNSTEHINGSFTNPDDIKELAKKCDVLTIEIEHIDVETLKELRMINPNLKIYPSPETIEIIQDKYIQKEHLIKNGLKVATSQVIKTPNVDSLMKIGQEYGYPFVLKSRKFAYDGRGNFIVKSKDDIPAALRSLKDRTLYAEKWAPFVKELAVMIVRTIDGRVFSYPVVETIHQNSICHLCYVPARVPDSIQLKAKLMAENTIKSFPSCGIFGVEMFYLENGEILINEVAPRPHNSGHFSIDACVTSQFEAHIRAILDLPIPKNFGNLTTTNTNAIMLNVLGASEKNGELLTCERALATPGASVYLYGKESRPNRKVGHINIISSSMIECGRKLEYIMGTTDEQFKISVADKMLQHSKKNPLVGIIMGSDSDLPVMSAACKILEQFEVPFEVTIVSAHRTPHRMSAYAIEASQRGIKTIIAGAGGAAHLPGMVAAMTALPVIGVPVKGSTLDGVDSLHSIVQMPRGVPVATVAINNSTNAALLAIRMLGIYNPTYLTKMQEFLLKQEEEVLQKAARLEDIGYQSYLDSK
ncbi:similar to Saccharomyces cerevisiae YOR128C ADE2 Phosphoribosylaminoimidazole carboxylase, catalyzes a step in the 'de novo' purine nucleotide biosynthetic pathway [Maudiozyma barnettii]|uniref:Phosphoribosylaminoimidazole carboxylase n=1 Tax=Maudiozyma barnettii TaxID=61262 RepID=A0A8H2ZF74_9SACH|nr:similar to Saccharomyces cerevisiae YOR128C ADE2 Phosphoribosylaminoimidazole carboxylase, catalyzes a step in the 'de novo' purine nucleotide biosynthetic pathway [Kazachstania barnettii]CAB4252040.1 similar to Saccharomyces cerevisiae YOR128C ADE2 Phosphoribosylaminoimidazole carboxylase, catalyzes a step in the 'de novo' purine nucleotide biosynthetic pathway [Kazachstania barnettii]CAD1778497.1 similar to Saccharomyces cerevisiae YOR128C ADE2 Phosphoribosylaminoimidazole carboxylase, catal